MLENINYTMVRELISAVFILAGSGFMLIASIGLLRFPDFYIRMSAITKGGTLGLGLIVSGMGIYFNQSDMLLKVIVIISFSFVTAPVAAHAICRTAVWNKIPFWKKTNLREFQDYLAKTPHDTKLARHRNDSPNASQSEPVAK